jgi:hypothetical protein
MPFAHSRHQMVFSVFAQMQALVKDYDFLIETCNVEHQSREYVTSSGGVLIPDNPLLIHVTLEFVGVPKPKEGGE